MTYKYHPIRKKMSCAYCKRVFIANTHNTLYCTTCRTYKRRALYGFSEKLYPTGTVGAISELMVAVDLMKKRYDVFRALSSHSKCDLIATKGNKTLRIEVRSGTKGVNGTVYASRKKQADILAIFIHSDNHIVYEPEGTIKNK